MKVLIQSKGINCMLHESTFYAFPDISSFGMSSWEFAKYLVKQHKVAVIPGSIFGDRVEGHVRISFAADSATSQKKCRKYQKSNI